MPTNHAEAASEHDDGAPLTEKKSALSYTQVSYFVSCFMLLGGMGLIFGAFFGHHWFETSTADSLEYHGLFRTCKGPRCEPISFENADLVTCDVSGSDLKFRIVSVRAAICVGVACAFMCLVFTVVGALKLRSLVFFGFAASLLAFVSSTVAMLFYYHSMEHWLFCNTEFCAWYRGLPGREGAPCVAYFGFSFALCCCGVLLCAIASIWSGATVAIHSSRRAVREATLDAPLGVSDPPPDGELGRGHGGVAAASPRPTNDPARLQKNPVSYMLLSGAPADVQDLATADQAANPGASDDYFLDENTGMYFSATEALYWDAGSGHYFDPTAQLWFDPSLGVWYEAADPEVAEGGR